MVSGAQNAKNAGAGHEALQSGASVVPHGGLRVERDCLVNSRISRMMLFRSMVVAQPPRASIAAQFLAIALALGVSEGHPFFRTRRTDCPLQIVSLMTRLAASESFLAAHLLAAPVVKNAPCRPTALICAAQHRSEEDEPTALAGSVSRARVAHANAIPRRTMPLRSLAREST